MIKKIENDVLSVEVNEMGCELFSVKSKSSGFEFLWQGNPDIWYGRAPILFPIVGRLYDDKYYIDGKEYTMPKHGLSRKLPFAVKEIKNAEITFIESETEETLKAFPYKFDLLVKYILEGSKLTVEHTVVNKNDCVMYFSLGAHPGFNCEIGDTLEFELNETLDSEKIDLVDALRITEKKNVLIDSKTITVTEDIFNEDALILSGIKSDYITLCSQSSSRKVKFNLGKAPYLGLWAKPGAPYVCIEPWFGVNDSHEKKDDISKKDQIVALEKGGSFVFTWSAEFSE